ncbi:MAG TPA: NYN domain-containing protein, partial [Planctomycetota bacterium]|nr:NYN domain-containing protein [Planctomycetota bacterium]
EKESDVAIAAKLLEVMARGAADVVVLVTGDTDLVPAVRTAKALFPAHRLFCSFPYRRKQRELEQAADGSFTISKEMYARFRLPSPLEGPGGRELIRPPTW